MKGGDATVHSFAVPLEPIPPRLVAVLRPEVPSMCEDVVVEVCRAIPEYAEAMHGPHGSAVRGTIDQALRAFIDGIASPAASTGRRDEMCRTLGRLQVRYADGMNHLETAFRLGVRVCWRRTVAVCRRHGVPADVQSSFADLLFGYVDELARLAREGYLEAQRNQAGEMAAHRRRLTRDLFDGRATESAIALAAREAHWPLPEQVTAVAVHATAPVDAGVLPSTVLHGRSRGRTILLVPGVVGDAEIATLRAALGDTRMVVGPAVPVRSVHHAVRWAARAYTLAEDGVLPEDDIGTTSVSDHLLTVWLSTDPALARHLVETRLAPLAHLTASQRDRLTETLYLWLVHNGSAPAMAEELGIHPQTVRYRMRALEASFGVALDDPEWRVSTELALRAQRLRRTRVRSVG